MRLKGAVVLVTGASSGIGEAAALRFARAGARLVLCARRPERLEATARRCRELGAEVLARPTDVRSREDSFALVRDALDEFHRLDVLVNNAGSGWRGRVEDMLEADVRRVVETNVFGVIWMTQAALPTMLERRRGVIVNVASVVGFRAVPYSSVYSASKYAVAGLSHGLRGELSGTGVKVSTVYPGGTKTSFGAGLATPHGLRVSADFVAASVVRAARWPRRDIVAVPFRVAMWFEPFLGGLLDHLLGEMRRSSMPQLQRPEVPPERQQAQVSPPHPPHQGEGRS